MEIHIPGELTCNGKPLKAESGCSLSWIPACCQAEGYARDTEAICIMDHYGLSADKAWVLYRTAFRWKGQREKELLSVKLDMKRSLNRYAGQSLTCPEKGKTVELTSPITGEKYRLTVHDIVLQETDPSVFRDADTEYPTHCLMMTYALEPNLSALHFNLQDICDGDSPRSKIHDGSCSVTAFIGRAYSPQVIGKSEEKAACSALHFDKEFNVEWVPMFSVKPM